MKEGGREPVPIPNEVIACAFCHALVSVYALGAPHKTPDGVICEASRYR